jgi:hypothetical protein
MLRWDLRQFGERRERLKRFDGWEMESYELEKEEVSCDTSDLLTFFEVFRSSLDCRNYWQISQQGKHNESKTCKFASLLTL